jgi:hypothetical protein
VSGPEDPIVKQLTEQQKLNNGYTLDLSIGKSWKIGDYYLGLNFNFNNVLNNTDMITGGYEQLRIATDVSELNKYPPKYYYGYGRSYFLMLTFRF